MKMENNHELEDNLRPEYDFSKMKGGVRGKYVECYRAGTNLVLQPIEGLRGTIAALRKPVFEEGFI